jgi:hypothetical protein
MPSTGSRLQVGDSSRLRLAQLALEAAAAAPGVEGVDAGPQGSCVTADPPAGLLRGVSVIAQADGRYSIDLCLVAGIVPLVALGDEIRSKLQARAEREGLAAQLGETNVKFVRVLGPGETLDQATREPRESRDDESRSGPELERESDSDTQTDPDTDTAGEIDQEPDTDAAGETDPEPDTDREGESGRDAESDPDQGTESEPDQETESDPVQETESEPDQGTDRRTEGVSGSPAAREREAVRLEARPLRAVGAVLEREVAAWEREVAAREREVAAREREVAAREREVAAREREGLFASGALPAGSASSLTVSGPLPGAEASADREQPTSDREQPA